MTMFHFFNCAILTFGPHAVYYSATPLSEYDTLGTSVKTAVVYLVTALVKLVCLATFLKVSESDSFDPSQELLKALIGFIDVAGLYFALTQLTHRNISQNHKFQAVGLGWAFADSVLHRLAPLWVGARGLEFTWEYILQGLEANANLQSRENMAAPDQVNKWLQSRINAQDEKIESLTNQVKDLSVSINSMKKILNELPKSIEKLTIDYQKSLGKQFVCEEAKGPSFKERTVTYDYESNQKIPNRGLESFIKHEHFETSLFSMPKVRLALFEGIDPRGWITKAELYFQVHQTPSPHKLELTQMYMDGSALNWFTNLLIKHPQTTWEQFRKKLLVRFGGTRSHNAHEALGSLYQEGDIDDYIENFEALSALISDQSEDQAVGMFLHGLQKDIKNWVRALQPRTCDQAMDLARHVVIATTIHGDKTNTECKTSFNNGTGGLKFSWKYAQGLIEFLDRPNSTNSALTNCQQIQLDTNLPQFSLLIQYPQGLPMSKIPTIHDWPNPKNAKVVRASPDLTGYHRGFIKDRGKMVALKKLLGRMQPPLNIGSMISGLRASLLFKTAALIENVPLAQAQAHILDDQPTKICDTINTKG